MFLLLSWKQTVNSLHIPYLFLPSEVFFMSFLSRLNQLLGLSLTTHLRLSALLLLLLLHSLKQLHEPWLHWTAAFTNLPSCVTIPLPTGKPLWTYSLLLSAKTREEFWEGRCWEGGAGSDELSLFSLWALPLSFPYYTKSHLDRQLFPSSFHFITDTHHVLKKVLSWSLPAKISTLVFH